jgi:hypothetical protein
MPESRHHPDEAEAAALDPVPDALATPRRDTDFTPWILSGVAVVSAGAGVFFVVRRADAIGEQRRYCTGGVCNGDYQRQVTAAESREGTSGTLAIAAFSVSAAALGTAVTLWLTADEERAGLSTLTLASGGESLDLWLGGRF